MGDFIPGFVASYPYTNFHELNADFLLKRMHEVEEHLASLDSYIDGRVNDAIQPYVNELNRLVQEVHNLEANVTATLESYQTQIDAQNVRITREFATMKANLEREFAAKIEELDRKIIEQDRDIENGLADLRRFMVEINNQLSSRFDLFREEINNQLAQFLAELPDYMLVRSPFSGNLVTVQEAINELYENTSRYRAITAAEFDALGLTAEEFDNLDITAWDFDTHGLDVLPVVDTLHNMFSPFTGLWSSLQTVINEIVDFSDRAHSITAEDFDAAELTAEEFDDLEMYAYTYDFNAADIIGA